MRKEVFVLAIVMIFTSIIPSFSYGDKQYNEKLEESVIKAKKLFSISDEYDKFDSSVNSYGGNTIFSLSWRDTKEELKNITVTMDIDGNVISFDSYFDNSKSDSKLPNYTKKQAQEVAMDFIKKISPDVKSIKLLQDKNPDYLNNENYNFQYIRSVNDLEYKVNSINLNVNKYTGEVVNYYINWDRDLAFPSPKDIIDKEEAKKLFKEKIGLKLVYKMKNNYYRPINTEDKDESKHYIAFTVLDNNIGIDAFTGEKISINQYSPYGVFTDGVADKEESATSGITPEERDSIDKLKNILNAKKAEEGARLILDIKDNYKLQNQSLYENYKNIEEYVWNMYFIEKDKDSNDSQSYVSIGIDAKTGELLSFNKSVNDNQKDKNTVNKDQALKLAKDYLVKQNPERKDKVELIEDNDYSEPNVESKVYNFRFIRKESGMYVEDDGIFLGVDAVNGEIVSYSLDWFNGEFPSNKGMISIEKAYEILWEKIGLDLMYVGENDDSIDLSLQTDKNMIIKLVYSLNSEKPNIIDALTGELLDYSGQPYRETESIKYDDIEGSYAKDKIKTLGEYGIGFRGEKFLPKEQIKQRELILLLWQTVYQYQIDKLTDEDMYNDFIKAGYIEESEKSPNSKVTKIEAAKYIIRIMNLREVAEIKGIYKDIFLDQANIKENEKGYINFAYGLKIINGNNTGNINPNYELKREDAASMIYNYLFR